MKNLKIKTGALVLLIALLSTVLVSCGGISGEYKASLLGQSVSYTFKGSSVEIDITLLGTVTTYEGKYKVDDDKITLTFDNEAEDAEKYEGTYTFEKGEDYIKIAGIEYTKVD